MGIIKGKDLFNMTSQKHNYSEPYIDIIYLESNIITMSFSGGDEDKEDKDDNQLDWV